LPPPGGAGEKGSVSRAPLLLALFAGACAARSPRIPWAGGLDAFLAEHPLATGQNIRADEVGRTETASYHVVQVRGGETPHRHLTHDLTVLVLRGHGTLTRGSEQVELTAGDAAVVPRAAPHRFANGGRGSAVALVVFVPPLDAPDSEPADLR
jgi:mannose-6-phosphate isomerase-like protein (cupin superfamily)